MQESTMASPSSKTVISFDDDRQPEIVIWPPKTEIFISPELWQMASKSQLQICFLIMTSSVKLLATIAITMDKSGQPEIARSAPKQAYFRFRVSVIVTIAWHSSVELALVKKTHSCRWHHQTIRIYDKWRTVSVLNYAALLCQEKKQSKNWL